MSPNRYKPHLLVWFEDDAYREIGNGFVENPALDLRVTDRSKPPFGGWHKVVDELDNINTYKMSKYTDRYILLLVDYDRSSDRLNQINDKIPEYLKDRIFTLGAFSEQEDLRAQLNMSFERIGRVLSQECSEKKWALWEHDLLKHNKSELGRMMAPSVRRFLFPPRQ